MPKEIAGSIAALARACLLMLVTMSLCAGCVGAPAGNALEGRQPTRVSDVARADVLTDGTAARAGDDWMTDLTAHFASPQAFVEYDLGASLSFAAAFLDGDHNDEYVVALSEDGVNFEPLWVAPPRDDGGQ